MVAQASAIDGIGRSAAIDADGTGGMLIQLDQSLPPLARAHIRTATVRESQGHALLRLVGACRNASEEISIAVAVESSSKIHTAAWSTCRCAHPTTRRSRHVCVSLSDYVPQVVGAKGKQTRYECMGVDGPLYMCCVRLTNTAMGEGIQILNRWKTARIYAIGGLEVWRDCSLRRADSTDG